MQNQGRVGDMALCPSDGHGCPACAHPVMGPAVSGSSNVLVNGLPALREGDPGIHAACCGPNQWQAKGGAPYVLINNKAAFRRQDPTSHCGGSGMLMVGSPNVFVGNRSGSAKTPPRKSISWIEIELVDEEDTPVPCEEYELELPDGFVMSGYLNSKGTARVDGIDPGQCKVTFPKLDKSAWEEA